MTDVATVFQALVGYDPEDGQTQLAIDFNATDYSNNYTQFLKADGLEVQLLRQHCSCFASPPPLLLIADITQSCNWLPA